jgi:hypothetical protein
MKKITLTKTEIKNVSTAYVVTDNTDKVLGFVASGIHQHKTRQGKKDKAVKHWGYALVKDEFKNGILYHWDSRQKAIESLITMRSISADTASITVIK